MSWKDTIADDDGPKGGSWRDSIVDDDMLDDKPGVVESTIRGATQGFPFIGSYADETAGALGAAKDFISGDSNSLSDNYVKNRDLSRAAYKEAEETNPVAYNAGMFGAALPVDAAKLIPGLGQAVGAVEGGVYGLGASEADLTKGNYDDALIDTGLSAGIGAVAPKVLGAVGKGIGKGASKLAKGSSDYLKDMAEINMARSLGAQKSQIKRLGEKDAKEVGRYALDNNLGGLFTSTDESLSRNQALMNTAGEARKGAYQAIDESKASTFNPLDVASGIEKKIVGDKDRSYLDTQELIKTLDPHLNNILSRGDQNIPMFEAQALVESLGKKAKFDTSRSNQSNEIAKEVYMAAREALNEAANSGAKNVGMGNLKGVIENANKQMSLGYKARDLLGNKTAQEFGNNKFGLSDTIIGAASIGTMGPQGALVAGAHKGLKEYGNRAVALSADKLGDILKANPNRFGKYAPILQKAVKRGGPSLGATHFILQQTQPEYRSMLFGDEDKKLDTSYLPEE